jgi:K+-transporting ATPase ATPase A chain
MHPFENPNGFTNFLQIFTILLIPFALTYAYGDGAGPEAGVGAVRRDGLVGGQCGLATGMETHGNPELARQGANQEVTATQSGGNFEGKETGSARPAAGSSAASTTGTSTGAVNCAHDSMTPLGGMSPMANMMLGEVSPGGTGAGLYGMLGLRPARGVHRRPDGRADTGVPGQEDPGRRDEARRALHRGGPGRRLCFAAISVVMSSPSRSTSILNPGPHGLSEVVYAFTSAGNNNGSAFGGLTGNTDWYNTTLGLAMLIGRFFLIIPAWPSPGRWCASRRPPRPPAPSPPGRPLFAGLLTGVVLIVVGLTYFPILALGPIVEHLGL